MEDQDENQSFEFVEEVAKSILNVLLQNPDNDEMLDTIQDEYQETNEYTNTAYETIKEIIFNNKELLENYHKICVSSKENMENLFNHLFFYREKYINGDQDVYEEEEDKSDYNDNLEIPFSVETPNIPDQPIISNETEKEKEHYFTPESLQDRIQNQINQISAKLSMSKNLSYLLLKKFNWNEEPLISQWNNKIQVVLNLFKELHVPEIAIKDDLLIKKMGIGDCPVCLAENVDLYQLYCGHYLCFDCWKEEINEQLKDIRLKMTPIHCRLDNCGSEIMISDVKKFCGEESAKNYETSIIENQTANDKKIVKCPAPDCPYYISINSLGPGSVATCKCGKQICWLCHKDTHSPLKCNKFNELERIRQEMERIEDEQKNWCQRELKCFKYRRSHIDEIRRAYDQFNERLLNEHNRQNEIEINEIQQLENELMKIQNDVEYQRFLKNTIIQKKIDHEIKEKSREMKQNLHKNDQNEYINSLLNSKLTVFKYGCSGFSKSTFSKRDIKLSRKKDRLNPHAHIQIRHPIHHQIRHPIHLQNYDDDDDGIDESKFTTNDEFIEAKTKKCPNCEVPILKHGGCNHMTCSRCLYQFCWLCGKEWKGIHKPCPLFGHPKISIESNDNNNSNSNENNDKNNSNPSENNNNNSNSNENNNNINSNSNENNDDNNSNPNQNNNGNNSNSNEINNGNNSNPNENNNNNNDNSNSNENNDGINSKLNENEQLSNDNIKNSSTLSENKNDNNNLKSIESNDNSNSNEHENSKKLATIMKKNDDLNQKSNSVEKVINNYNFNVESSPNIWSFLDFDEIANDDNNANDNDNNANDNDNNANDNDNDNNANDNDNNANDNDNNDNNNVNDKRYGKRKSKKKSKMTDSSDFEDDDTIIDKSFKIPPVNSVFSEKHKIFHKNHKQYLNCVNRHKYESGNPLREKAYERSKFIFKLDEVDEKFKEILHSYDHALNVLMYGYLHAILMDHETGAFLMFNELLESLQSTYDRFYAILYYCPSNQPYGQIIDLSKRIEKMANDILNAFEL